MLPNELVRDIKTKLKPLINLPRAMPIQLIELYFNEELLDNEREIVFHDIPPESTIHYNTTTSTVEKVIDGVQMAL